MTVDAKGIALIKSQEACRLEAYRCPAGVWTIGYGHTGFDVHEGLRIDQVEAEALLAADLVRYDAAVQKTCPEASAGQHAAMVSLCFNIGPAAFTRSSTARLHNARRYGEAAQAFALWNKASGRVLPGLVARRATEATLYLSDMPQPTSAEFSTRAAGEKTLSESRTLAGTAISGTAAAAAGVAELMHQLNDFRDTVTELLPYFTEVRWVLLALTMAGVALSAYARWRDRREGRS